MEITPMRRVSSGGFLCGPLASYFQRLPILWKEVEEMQSRKEHLGFFQSIEYTGKLKSSESREKLAETIRSKHQSILIRSKEAADYYKQFRYQYNQDSTFAKQAPIRTSFKSAFAVEVVENFNPDDKSNSEIFMESIKRAACFLFKKKQEIFLKGLAELVNLHEYWMNYYINHGKSHKSLKIIKRLYDQVEVYGMDLNLLFFQADIYMSTAFTVMNSCEGASIHDIEPSRFYLVNEGSKIFFFEEHTALNYYYETFHERPEEQYAAFDRYLQNYINEKEMEAGKPAAETDNDDEELDGDTLFWALEWVADQEAMGA